MSIKHSIPSLLLLMLLTAGCARSDSPSEVPRRSKTEPRVQQTQAQDGASGDVSSGDGASAEVAKGSRAQTAPAASQTAGQRSASSPGEFTDGEEPRIRSAALASPVNRPTGRFTRLPAEQTNLDFTYEWETPDFDYDFRTLLSGGGACIGDYDGDGLADVYLTSQAGVNRLYRNLGNWRFQDVTEDAGIADPMWGMGATFVDIDNDGDLDLVACAYQSPNRLYINQGDGTFQERAKEFGLDYNGASIMMAIADYDQDGHLDGCLVTNRRQPKDQAKFNQRLNNGLRITSTTAYYVEEIKEFMGIIMRPNRKFLPVMAGQLDQLYHNQGDGTFEEVGRASGINGYDIGLAATWWDYDADGWTDLYISNDYTGPDRLYRNNRDGTFTDVAAEALPHMPWSSMGANVADLNNDGRLDFIASDMASSTHEREMMTIGDMGDMDWFLDWGRPRQYIRNAVFLNSGTRNFMEIAHLTGMAQTDWTWSPKCADLDEDGRVDVFFTNGMTRDWLNLDLMAEIAKQGGYFAPKAKRFWHNQSTNDRHNLAFRNEGNLEFKAVGPDWGLDHKGISIGAALGDLDGDGDLDLVINNFEEPAGVYRNDISNGHRIKIRLIGTTSNRWGIGATVRLTCGDQEQVRFLTLSRGFMSADNPLVHFGLGPHVRIDRLSILWPSGHEQSFSDLAADHYYQITEPEGSPLPRNRPPSVPALLTQSDCLSEASGRERLYDDMQRQPLLPRKLSQMGPGMAWGDLDGDGLDDLYLGGAAGFCGDIYLNLGDCRFKKNREFLIDTAADQDAESEDMAVVMFDADSDDDLDLFVVSGGNECEVEEEVLRDRLYFNDGKGNLTKAPEDTLPDLRDSGSVAVAADFDRDGDLDLFVGGRQVPGEYPVTPHSRLLQNDQGRFTDMTARLAPELEKTGLVTSALWSDADGDGWIDLLVTHVWGPVKFYQNRQGRLVDQTSEAKLETRRGWYHGIAGRDIDGDGDIDYVVTNLGLNTKDHATAESPARLYYGDFDGLGIKNLVEAKQQAGRQLPVRDRSCASDAMPFIAVQLPTYHDYATATLEEIYTPASLARALMLEANSQESGILVNDGQAHFTFRPLPRIAQIAPGFGVVLTELNGDGHPDLVIAQNSYSPHSKVGRMDGGLSLLLVGDGAGDFEPVWPDRSGLVLPVDAKSLTVTDLNGDHWPDLVFGINSQPVEAFLNATIGGGHSENRVVSVRLKGPVGNRSAVGSRVTAELAGGTSQTAEVSAGGGYLSQSTTRLTFGLPEGETLRQIQVVWPDGSQSTHTGSDDAIEISLH